jgi:hypothetical protein
VSDILKREHDETFLNKVFDKELSKRPTPNHLKIECGALAENEPFSLSAFDAHVIFN